VEGKVDLDEIDRKEKAKAERLKREEEERKFTAEQKLKNGRPGKGISKDYVVYCKNCRTEYLIKLEKCTHCGYEVVDRETRMKDLEEKLTEYKENKATKKMRRAKWENWRKTQAIRYSKMATNYQKWDYFESDSESDEEKKEPIVPDDPNVKMLEKDIEQRAKLRRENRAKSDELKAAGNEYMKKGKPKAAYKKYTQAIELSKDYFILYTNRALASLKLEHWNDAVDDCSRVLDYCECFDDGYTKRKDLCYKALTRRAAALQAMKKLDLAKKDAEEALKLFPDLEETVKLLKRINEDIDLEQKIDEVIKKSSESVLLQYFYSLTK